MLPRGRGEERVLGAVEQETVVGTIKHDAVRANEKRRSQLASSASAFSRISSGRVAGGVPLHQEGTTAKAEICTETRWLEEFLTFGVRKHKQESSEGSRYPFWVADAVEQASS